MRSAAFRYGLGIISLLALANGCSSYPEARYYKATVDALAEKECLIPFALQGALVTIAPRPDPTQMPDEKMKQPEKQIAVLGLMQNERKSVEYLEGLKEAQVFATPMDAADSLYLLEPNDSFLSESNISVTYYDGHHRIKAIGTEFQDNRIKVIEAIGGTVTAMLPLLAFPEREQDEEESLELPLAFDFTNPKRFGPPDAYTDWEKIPNYRTWWYRYKVSQPMGRVFRTQDFFEKRNGRYTREFPISACADLTLQIGKGKNATDAQKAQATFVVRVPHPSFVQPLPFPRKGTIVFHTVCGADLTVQASQAANDFTVLETIAKQVNAIWQAQQKKTGGNQKKDAGGEGK